MKSEITVLCPFDKNPCIRKTCAVWSEEKGICSFAFLPDLVKKENLPVVPAKERPMKHATEDGSGKYRTLLFD